MLLITLGSLDGAASRESEGDDEGIANCSVRHCSMRARRALRTTSTWAKPGGSSGIDEAVPNGWVENKAGGRGNNCRTSDGNVCAWTSKSKGERRDARTRLLFGEQHVSFRIQALIWTFPTLVTHAAALTLSKTSRSASSRARAVSEPEEPG